MSYRLEFTLPKLPKMGLNANSNWRSRWAHAKSIKREVWRLTWPHRPPEPLEHAKVSIERCSSVRPDYDNLCAGAKHVVDGLVEAGILAGDKFENIGTPVYTWSKAAPSHGCVRVKVEQLTKEQLHDQDTAAS